MFIGCSWKILPPDAVLCVCGALVHLKFSPKLFLEETEAYCSAQCVYYGKMPQLTMKISIKKVESFKT